MKYTYKKSFFVTFMLGLIIAMLLPFDDIPVRADEGKNSPAEICNFWDFDDDRWCVFWRSADSINRIIVFEYEGPKWEKISKIQCVCDNTFYYRASRYYYNATGTEYCRDDIFNSEKFNWKESRRIFVFLPASDTGSYEVCLAREKTGLINQCQKDCTETNGRGKQDGSGLFDKDCINMYLSWFEIGNVGLDKQKLSIGDKCKARFECKEYLGQVKWHTDDEDVLTVTDDGTVVANNSGDAMLYLSIDGQNVYSQKISVKSVDRPKDLELYENDRKKIEINGINGNVTWESSDSSIATIDGGNVIAKGIGEAIISGTCNGFKTSFKVKVLRRDLSVDEIQLYSGEKATIELSGSSVEAKWSSENNKVIEVENGVIRAKKPGKATITVKAGSQTLVCKAEVLKSELSATSLNIRMGETVTLDVIGSSATPIISSSDENVIAVKKGNIVSVGTGKATISYSVGDETLKCKIKVVKKPAPTGITYEVSSKVIKLKWDVYDEAKSYSVYMYDTYKKEYILIGSPKKEAFTIKDLEASKTYIFRVAANVKINGALIEQALSDKIKVKTEKKDKIGWQTIEGKKYYYKDGFAIGNGIQKIDGNKYIFDSEGVLVVNQFITIDGNKYYSDKNGKIAVNMEVSDKDNNVTYVADKDGILSKKKVKSTTKTVTFNDITLEIPTSWGSVTKDGDSYIYSFDASLFMIYTDPKDGSLTQKKADWLVDEFKYYCCESLSITKSKKYEYDKKISTYYLYTMNLTIPGWSGSKSAACKGRLTAFEYNGKYYVAVMMIEKSKCDSDSFDEYTDVIKSIKPVSKSSGDSTKKSSGGSNKTSSMTVYITDTGACYHYLNPCGNGKYHAITLEEAKRRGYLPCDKCVH